MVVVCSFLRGGTYQKGLKKSLVVYHCPSRWPEKPSRSLFQPELRIHITKDKMRSLMAQIQHLEERKTSLETHLAEGGVFSSPSRNDWQPPELRIATKEMG